MKTKISDIRKVLTKKNFEAWLLSKDPDYVVGESNSYDSCPLYSYLDECGLSVIEVCPEGINFKTPPDSEDLIYSPPLWVDRFIEDLDEYFFVTDTYSGVHYEQEPVTRDFALKVLRKELPKK